MKACAKRYGSRCPRTQEVAKPAITDDQVLVRVHALSINAGDYFSMRGSSGAFSVGFPSPRTTSWAGTWPARRAGQRVTQFQPGDAVFGAVSHAFAEYVVATASKLAPKPANLSFEQAAAVPTAGLTPCRAARCGQGQPAEGVDQRRGRRRHAVQIAKALGAR